MKPRICLTILAFAFIVPATEANAQLMPDSTVQITAYWQKGDQMTYDYRSTECLVEDGDTVRLRSYSDIRTIEVIDATPTRYTLRISNHRHFEQDPIAQMIYGLEQREGLNVPLIIETSLDGELLCVVNAAQIVEAAHKLSDRAAETLYDSLPDPVRRTTPQWEWQNIIEKWINPDAATTRTIEDIGRIFFFHGTRFRPDTEYERHESLRLPMTDAEADCVTTFWADGATTDAASAMLHTPSVSQAEEAMRTTAAAHPEALLLGGAITPEQAPDTSVTMESFSGEEIHFASGWPLQAYWSTRLTASTPDGRRILIRVRKQLTRRDSDAPLTSEAETPPLL